LRHRPPALSSHSSKQVILYITFMPAALRTNAGSGYICFRELYLSVVLSNLGDFNAMLERFQDRPGFQMEPAIKNWESWASGIFGCEKYGDSLLRLLDACGRLVSCHNYCPAVLCFMLKLLAMAGLVGSCVIPWLQYGWYVPRIYFMQKCSRACK
jgi:hypothetical protein